MTRTVLASLLLLALAVPAFADLSTDTSKEAEPAPERRELPPAKMPTLTPRQSPRGGAFILRGGIYQPDDIFHNAPDSPVTYKDIYGGGAGMFALEWEAQPVRIHYVGTLGIGAGAGFFQKKGKALKEDGTSSSQDLTLRIIPATADIVYRMALFDNQPIVPYVGAGLDYWYFTETKSGVGASDNVSGGKKGWHWRAGGALLLDVFDPTSAGALDANWGLNNTYLFGEYRANLIDNFNRPSGFDLTDRTWAAGLMLDY